MVIYGFSILIPNLLRTFLQDGHTSIRLGNPVSEDRTTKTYFSLEMSTLRRRFISACREPPTLAKRLKLVANPIQLPFLSNPNAATLYWHGLRFAILNISLSVSCHNVFRLNRILTQLTVIHQYLSTELRLATLATLVSSYPLKYGMTSFLCLFLINKIE